MPSPHLPAPEMEMPARRGDAGATPAIAGPAETSRQQLVTLIAAMPDAVVVIDAEDIVRFVNPAARALFCRPEEDLIGERIGFAVERDTAAEIDLLAGGEPRRAQLRVVGCLWDGKPARLAIMRDISEQTRLEEKLASERALGERRFRDALDASAGAILMIDRAQRIVLSNRAACRLFGYDAGVLPSLPVEAVLPGAVGSLDGVEGQGHAALRRTARRLDGTTFPVDIGVTAFRDASGGALMLTIADATMLVEHEKSLQQRNLELSRLNQELTQFAYSVSHDLKAPLVTVAGLLDLSLEDLDDMDLDACRQNITDALDTCRRNASKIEAVLGIAQAGESPVDVAAVDLGYEIALIWRDLTGSLDRRPRLQLDVDGCLAIEIERQTLLTILENLLSNAVRYRDRARDDPSVRIWARIVAGRLEMSVDDDGLGIPPRHLPRVFDLFSRFSEHSGTGLGLALVKKHVDRLKGRISVSSEGRGTCFRLSLPIAGQV